MSEHYEIKVTFREWQALLDGQWVWVEPAERGTAMREDFIIDVSLAEWEQFIHGRRYAVEHVADSFELPEFVTFRETDTHGHFLKAKTSFMVWAGRGRIVFQWEHDLTDVFEAADSEEYDKARTMLNQLRKEVGASTSEMIRAASMLMMEEGL